MPDQQLLHEQLIAANKAYQAWARMVEYAVWGKKALDDAGVIYDHLDKVIEDLDDHREVCRLSVEELNARLKADIPVGYTKGLKIKHKVSRRDAPAGEIFMRVHWNKTYYYLVAFQPGDVVNTFTAHFINNYYTTEDGRPLNLKDTP